MRKNKTSHVLSLILLIMLIVFVARFLWSRTGTEKPKEPQTPSNVSTSSTSTVTTEGKTYENKFYNYKITYPDNTHVEDVSSRDGVPIGSSVVITPLYVGINAKEKPLGYTTLKKYVADFVMQTMEDGQQSAAGVYATSSSVNINGQNAFKVIISDGSDVKNTDEEYFFEKDKYVYTFDFAYSEQAYQSHDIHERARVQTAKQILNTFMLK